MVMVLGIATPLWVAFRIYERRRTSAGTVVNVQREALLFAFFAYVVAVITMTVLPFRGANALSFGTANFVPFRTMMQCLGETLSNPSDLITRCIANFFGNLALLFPLGLFGPVVLERLRSPRRFFLTALALSMAVEVIQLLETSIGGMRTADIDDVILNVLGACAGFLLYSLVRSFLRPRRQR